MPNKPNIVFAHGLWADGSCFSKVIELLVADGYKVIATQNQLNTVAVAAVRTSLGRVGDPRGRGQCTESARIGICSHGRRIDPAILDGWRVSAP